MRIALILNITRNPKHPVYVEEEPHPEGNNFAHIEHAPDHSEPELVTGFQRNVDWG